jgi:hypothetical protein
MRAPAVRALLLAAGVGVIVVMVVRTGPALLMEMLHRVGWNVATVVMLYAGHVGLRALALWRVVVRRPARFVDVLRVRLSAEAVEVLTYTGPFLAEPAKGWLLVRHGMPAAEAFAAVATEYLLYTTLSAALALTAFSLLVAYGMVPVLFRPAALAIAAAMAAFIGAVCYAAATGVGLIVPIVRASGVIIGRRRAARAAEVIDPVERVLVSFLHDQPARLGEVLAIEAVAQSLLMLEICVVLASLGAAFSVREPLIIEGGGKLTVIAFFFIPGQVGAAEAVSASLLRAVGLPASAGLTLAFVRRIRSVCVASAGLLVFARRDTTHARHVG